MTRRKPTLSKGQAIMIAMRDAPEGATTVDLAKAAGVSQPQASLARVVQERRPDLVESVVDGSTSLNKAYQLARETTDPPAPPQPRVPNRPVLLQEHAEAQLDPKHDLDPDVRAGLAKRLCDAHNEEVAVHEEARELVIEGRTRKQQLMSVLGGLSAAELDRFLAVVGMEVNLDPEPEPETGQMVVLDLDDDNDGDNDIKDDDA